MTYAKSTDFAAKDYLLTGNPNKLIRGVEIDDELTAIESEFANGVVSKTGNTGSAKIPAGTQGQRDASPSAGYVRFNSTTGAFEGYNGTEWGPLGSNNGPVVDIETYTATASQTVFPLVNGYEVGKRQVEVFVNGLLMTVTTDYVETDYQTITFNSGLTVGDEVTFRIWRSDTLADGDAANMSYSPAGGAAVTSNVQTKLRESVSVKDFGAVGDGVADDTAAIQAALAAVLANSTSGGYVGTLYFPFGVYKVSAQLTVKVNVEFEAGAQIKPSGMAANAIVYLVQSRTIHRNVVITGTAVTDRANGTVGFFVDGGAYGTVNGASFSVFENCTAYYMKYGFVVNTFSTSLVNCNGVMNTCNLSVFASNTTTQIHDLKVFGGRFHDSAGSYNVKIGDADWATTIPAGNSHGQKLAFYSVAFENGSFKIDSVQGVLIESCNWEMPSATATINTTAKACVEIGTTGQDGYVRNVDVHNCYFMNTDYGVYCQTGVYGVSVEDNTCISVSTSELYIASDQYEYTFKGLSSTASFTKGPQLHTGQRSASVANFATITANVYGIVKGVQSTQSDVGRYIPRGQIQAPTYSSVSVSTSNGAVYTTPTTGIAGTLNSTTLFTFTTASNAKYFNAGDRVTFSLGGSAFVYKVNYEAGTMQLAAASGTTNGAQNISQVADEQVATRYANAAPTTGTWAVGSRTYRLTATVGQPKSWVCTVAGTPGTWVSEGNL